MDFDDEILGVGYISAFLLGAGLLIWHSFNWLKSGYWYAIPARSVFAYFDANLSFIFNPTEWFGLAKILRWYLELPLFIAGPVFIILTAHILVGFFRWERG